MPFLLWNRWMTKKGGTRRGAGRNTRGRVCSPWGDESFPALVERRALVFYRAIPGRQGRKRESGTVVGRGLSEKVREKLTTPNERGVAAEVLTRRVRHFTHVLAAGHRRGATPLGLDRIGGRFPRVARGAQPWAEGRNAVGVFHRSIPAGASTAPGSVAISLGVKTNQKRRSTHKENLLGARCPFPSAVRIGPEPSTGPGKMIAPPPGFCITVGA